MATPAPSWDLVRVYGTWNNQNGTRKAGSYRVMIPQRVVDATDDVIIPAGKFLDGTLNVTAGLISLDVLVPAVDDADISPRNFPIVILVQFNDPLTKDETFNIRPTIAGGPINLRKIVPGTDAGDIDVDPPLTDSQILANASAYTDTQVDAHEAAANPHPVYASFVDAEGNPIRVQLVLAGAGEPFPAITAGPGLLFYGGS